MVGKMREVEEGEEGGGGYGPETVKAGSWVGEGVCGSVYPVSGWPPSVINSSFTPESIPHLIYFPPVTNSSDLLATYLKQNIT